MNLRLFLGCLSALFLFSTCKIDHNYQLKTTFKRVVPDLLHDFDVPGIALIVVEDGKVDYEQYSGFVDPENGTKWQKSTVLPALRIEESLISWLLLQQVQKGTLQIDEPIKPFWKVWPINDQRADSLTLGHLLSHQSGFAPGASMDSLHFDHAPGTVFEQHSLNLEFAKILATQLLDQAYPELLRQSVLEPLGMNQATFGGVLPDTWTVDGQRQKTPAYDGLSLDLNDLKQLLLASLRKDSFLMSPALLDTMHYAQPGTDGHMGLGYQTHVVNIRNRHSGQRSEWQNIHTVLVLDRERQNGMIVATTGENSDVLIKQLICKWTKFHGGNCSWDMVKIPLARALEKPYREGGKTAMLEQYDIYKKYYNTSYQFRKQVLRNAAAELLEDSNRQEFARDLLLLNAQEYPKDDQTIRLLGIAFESNGQLDSAARRLQEAYLMNPGHVDLPERLQKLGVELDPIPSYQVKFVVKSKTVPAGDTIYIAGSHPKLGEWEVGQVPMSPTDQNQWSIEFELLENTELEYKYNLGDWDTEALTKRKRRMQNAYLKVEQDTILERSIKFWADESD